MTIVFPGTIGKCSFEKERPILTEFVLIMNNSYIQYKALLVEYAKVAQKINSFRQKCLVFCQFQINFNIFEVRTVSVTVHDNIQLVCISLEVYTNFSPTIIFLSISGKEILLWNQLFQRLAYVAIQLQLV